MNGDLELWATWPADDRRGGWLEVHTCARGAHRPDSAGLSLHDPDLVEAIIRQGPGALSSLRETVG